MFILIVYFDLFVIKQRKTNTFSRFLYIVEYDCFQETAAVVNENSRTKCHYSMSSRQCQCSSIILHYIYRLHYGHAILVRDCSQTKVGGKMNRD